MPCTNPRPLLIKRSESTTAEGALWSKQTIFITAKLNRSFKKKGPTWQKIQLQIVNNSIKIYSIAAKLDSTCVRARA